MGSEKGIEARCPLPAHSVRVSSRARRVLLRVIPGKGLEVVVPVGFDTRDIPGILIRHGDWIAKQLKRLAAKPALDASNAPLPETIDLRAMEAQFRISYRPSSGRMASMSSSGLRHLILEGSIEDVARCLGLIRSWVRIQSEMHLPRLLERVSHATGLGYEKVQIRDQKRRWGSYSSRGTVSLNWKLIFLPPELVRYLMIHELCHSVHLNHSASFWELVGRHEPDFRALDSRLRKARDFVPFWADLS